MAESVDAQGINDMKNITYYKPNGEIAKKVPLNKTTIKDCHGMKVKCILIDGNECVGFANPFYSFEKGSISIKAQELDYITLETYINLDEETHTFVGDIKHKFDINREAVSISSISHIDAILYSGLRWDGIPTNKFCLKTNS